MIKRLVSVVSIILISVLLFCSCNQIASVKNDDKISVVATIFPAFDGVREVSRGTDDIDLKLLLKPGSEAHSYEPTPQDIIAIQNCDVFIYVGGESDEWVKNILSSIDTNSINIVSMMDCVELVKEETVEGMEEEKNAKETYEPEYDEHVWTSPRNAIKIVDKINSSMAESRPVNKEIYNNNTISYNEKLEQLDKDFHEIVKSGKRNTIVFGDRFPFRYFADEYGLEYYAAFPGCSEETEASAKTVSFLIDKIKTENIPVVLYPELSNQKVAKTICESTGAVPLQFNSCHNLTNDEFENGATYLSLMKENINTLQRALN